MPVVGDTITYTLTATNTGNTTLTGVAVTDTRASGLSCRAPTPLPAPAGPATLLPGQSLVCTGRYALTQADIDAGSVANTATATSGQTAPQIASDNVAVPQVGALTLAKRDLVTKLSVVQPAARWDAGDIVVYELTLSNAGNTTLTGVSVADPKLPTLHCIAPGGGGQPADLLPGEDLECVGIYTVTQADIDAGRIVNTATATGTTPSGGSTEASTSDTVGLTRQPALTLAKTATPVPNIVPPDNRLDPGDRIDYQIVATNDGNVTLTGVTVSDPLLPNLTCTPPAPATPTTLLPGEDIVCSGSHTLTQGDVDAGGFSNTATGRSSQTHRPARASRMVVLPRVRAFSLVKRVASPPAPGEIRVGSVLDYEYVVTNTGNVALSGPVTVADNGTTVSCPSLTRPLAPGESTTCTSSYTVTQADVDAGRVTNTATATVNGRTSEPSVVSLDPVQVRSLSLVKSATPESYGAAGDTIHYSYTVTNTGNVTLAGPVTVTDSLAEVSCPAGGLAPNASTTCTAAYTTTSHDASADSVTNVATAHANGTDSNEARATVIRTGTPPPPPPPPPSHPAIAIVKTPASQQVQRGATARFTIRVTNTGTATLTGVTVSDPRAPACNRTSSTLAALAVLAPGASVSYECSLGNVGAAFTNVATATGTGPTGVRATASSSARVTLAAAFRPPAQPAVTIVKGPARQTVRRGGTASFVVVVRNIGNVALHDVRVSDPRVPDCARRFASLAAGASRSYRCTLTGVHESFRHIAVVTGRSPAGVRVLASAALVAVRVVPLATPTEPAILIVKEPDLQTVEPGATAHFQVTVANVGTVTLHDVKVSDPPTPECNRTIGTLAPGRRVIYNCASADVRASFTNVATASGVSPVGTPATSTDFVVVDVTTAPAPPPLQTPPPFTG
jgi:uncharacterized repeat protein (TIGR01451 family)